MSSNLLLDPKSGLLLPRKHVDEKLALKKVIDDVIDNAVLNNQHLKKTYYLTINAKFDKHDPSQFQVSQPVITYRLPPFMSNQLVFWVSNSKGICELLWMVIRGNDGKLKVEFNKEGVAYLQAKGAMPSAKG
jgi:hypothetical protein